MSRGRTTMATPSKSEHLSVYRNLGTFGSLRRVHSPLPRRVETDFDTPRLVGPLVACQPPEDSPGPVDADAPRLDSTRVLPFVAPANRINESNTNKPRLDETLAQQTKKTGLIGRGRAAATPPTAADPGRRQAADEWPRGWRTVETPSREQRVIVLGGRVVAIRSFRSTNPNG